MIWMPTLLAGRLMGAEIGGKPRLQQGLSLKSNDLSTLYRAWPEIPALSTYRKGGYPPTSRNPIHGGLARILLSMIGRT